MHTNNIHYLTYMEWRSLCMLNYVCSVLFTVPTVNLDFFVHVLKDNMI